MNDSLFAIQHNINYSTKGLVNKILDIRASYSQDLSKIFLGVIVIKNKEMTKLLSHLLSLISKNEIS